MVHGDARTSEPFFGAVSSSDATTFRVWGSAANSVTGARPCGTANDAQNAS
jgi:hypothetical protein